jgi:hypothetical protein
VSGDLTSTPTTSTSLRSRRVGAAAGSCGCGRPRSALGALRDGLSAAADDRLIAVGPDEELDVLGMPVRTYGGQHALIHSSVPVVTNIGYLIGERLYHPGDSFAVPPVAVDTLLVPTHAPWSKVGEVLDFLIAVRPRRSFQGA